MRLSLLFHPTSGLQLLSFSIMCKICTVLADVVHPLSSRQKSARVLRVISGVYWLSASHQAVMNAP